MATGLQILARKAILSTLKADAPLIAIVPAADIHSQRVPAVPAWPFIKLGPPSTIPLRGSCIRGGVVTLAVHAFAKPRISGETEIETAEDYCGRIGSAIEAALDGARIDTSTVKIGVKLSDMRLLVDGAEADAFHYVCNANCRVLA
jgi:hypothetical protein